MNTAYGQGTRWELTTNAGHVPRGIYTLVGLFDEVLVFQVGPHIQFALVERFYRPFLKQVNRSSSLDTREHEFLDRYDRLARKPRPQFGGVEGMSFVFMHPRLVKRPTHTGHFVPISLRLNKRVASYVG